MGTFYLPQSHSLLQEGSLVPALPEATWWGLPDSCWNLSLFSIRAQGWPGLQLGPSEVPRGSPAPLLPGPLFNPSSQRTSECGWLEQPTPNLSAAPNHLRHKSFQMLVIHHNVSTDRPPPPGSS